MIEFLQSYTTEAVPPEHFAKGAQVERSEASERYFVGRGLAGYVVDGTLVDAEHRPIVAVIATVGLGTSTDHSAALALTARAGEVMTGQPPRASSGPGVPIVEPASGIAGSPGVVLEAEVSRLSGELAEANAEGDELAQKLAQALGDLQAERQAHASTRDEITRLKTSLGAADSGRAEAERQVGDLEARVATLEDRLAEATKPAGEQQEQKPADKQAKGK